MKILDREVQLMSDEERKNSHRCFICNTDKSVKYTINIGNYEVCFCNKCVAKYSDSDDKTVFKAAMKSSDSYFDGDKFIQKLDIKEEYDTIKESSYRISHLANEMLYAFCSENISKEKIDKINKEYNTLNEYLDEKYGNDRDERFLKFLKENSTYKNPDDDIRVYPLPNRTDNRPCSACGSTVSVKYFFMDKKDKSHLLCNRCAAIRDFSCAYENSGAHTKEQFEKVQKEIDEFSNKPGVVDFDYRSMYPSELRFNGEETIEKDISKEDDNDEEKKYVYVYCTRNYNLQLNLDDINELIDEIITSIELDSKTMETTILDIYEYRDSAYKAMCLDYHSMIICSDNHISGSRSKDYMYDIKYVYDINTGDFDVYMVYKKEVI